MAPTLPLAVTWASLLLLPATLADGLYDKQSPVLQVSGNNYDSLIAKSNYTSIVEFYAPWCGHCKNLKPAYEKAATSLAGLAKVASVNCDEDSNKPLCGSMGVQGFPTLKIVKPGKKAGKPVVEDYQGARTAKGIVDAVIDKIPNHVKRLKDDDYQAWLEQSDGAKAILFSDKGTTSALLKSIAIDFLGSIDLAQIRDKEAQAIEVFQVKKFPSLILLPGGGEDPVTYNGEMRKSAMVSFLSQVTPPNPDPAPKKAKSSSKTNQSQASKASSSFAKASASQASSQAKSAPGSQTAETLDDESQPTESPNPNVVPDDAPKPIKLPDPAAPIYSIPDALSLRQKCLNTKSGTCVLALLPPSSSTSSDDTTTLQAQTSLAEIHHKHASSSRKLFPFYLLPATNSQTTSLRSQLNLDPEKFELIAINGKRSWYRHYTKSSHAQADIEDWIDSIRMGEGAKSSIPAGLIVDATELPSEEAESAKGAGGGEATPASQGMQRDEAEAMKEALKDQLPEGVEMEIEEIEDDEYERIIRDATIAAQKAEEEREEGEAQEGEGKKGRLVDEL